MYIQVQQGGQLQPDVNRLETKAQVGDSTLAGPTQNIGLYSCPGHKTLQRRRLHLQDFSFGFLQLGQLMTVVRLEVFQQLRWLLLCDHNCKP